MLASHAFTRGQVEGVEAAFRRHLQRFPADEGTEALHGLGHVRSDVEMREADSRRSGLTEKEHAEREALLERTNEGYRADLAAPEAVPLLTQACHELRAWLDAHPGDALVRSRVDTFTDYAALAEQMRAAVK